MIVNLFKLNTNVYIGDINEIEIDTNRTLLHICSKETGWIAIPTVGFSVAVYPDNTKTFKSPMKNPTEEKIFKALNIKIVLE